MKIRIALAVMIVAASLAPVLAQETPQPTAETGAPSSDGEIDLSTMDQIYADEDLVLSGFTTYDPAGRPDPFRSLLTIEVPTDGTAPKIEQLNLQGLLKLRNQWVAQMQTADAKVILLRAGDPVGDGEVMEITANEIVFRQLVNDPGSLKPFREVRKILNPDLK